MNFLRFIQAVRRLVARPNPVTAAVLDAIERAYLPYLEKKGDMAKLALWQGIVEEIRQDGRAFDQIAWHMATRLVNTKRPGAAEPEDLVSHLTLALMEMSDAQVVDYLDKIRDFNHLKAYLTTWFKHRILDYFSHQTIHSPGGISTMDRDDEQVQIVDILEAPSTRTVTQEDRREIEQMRKDLFAHAKARLTSEQYVLFLRWMEMNEEKGADDVNILRDVIAPLAAQDGVELTPSSQQAYYKRYNRVRQVVADYFRRELDIDVPSRLVPAASADRRSIAVSVAAVALRRAIARWVLIGR